MTPREANIVITKAGLFDGRKSSVEASEAWGEALGAITLEDALEAVRIHYSRSQGYIMPADIVAIVNVKRKKAREAEESRLRDEERRLALEAPPRQGSIAEWYRNLRASQKEES